MAASELALTGGRPAVQRSAPMWPVVGDLEVAWMEAVVRSGQWSWVGPHESAFCREFAGFVGAAHCCCMANGTVTLQCALQAVGVKPGDEVIVPGLTWVATAQAAMDIGADVVLVDIDEETMCLDPQAFAAAITPRTRAVVPVHLYGCMADMDAIREIAAKHDIKIIEDVAHQHGSRWRNIGAGAIGDAGSFSFQQSKVLTCGEGGAVTTNDPDVYDVAFCLKQVGWKPDLRTPGEHYGHNYRITEMQAVLLRGGLRRLPEQTRRREVAAARLAAGLAEVGAAVRVAKPDPRVTRQAYYALTMHFMPEAAAGLTRDQYLQALAAEGFRLGGPYWPVYRSPLLNLYDTTSPIPFRDPARTQDYANLRLPVVEKVCNDTGVTLGHGALLGDDAYIDELIAAAAKVQAALDHVRAHFARCT